MKTFREWFEELPEPYRTQAIHNYDSFGPYENYRYNPHDIETLSSAVLNAFDWTLSKQGTYYWNEFHNNLSNIEL